jgi:pyruvate/2-oxoacid:ferredoxin oxidoreductase beta subunit
MRELGGYEGTHCHSHYALHGIYSTIQQAVEYYESNSDPRYRIYQKRLEHFLKKQNIDDILRGKSGQLVSKKDTAEKKITHARTKSKS